MIMEEKFCSWLIRAEGKVEATGINYSKAIHVLSQHYSSHTGTSIDIYTIDNNLLKKIKGCYDSDGKFFEKGYERHGLYRAAIKAFYRFRQAYPVIRSNPKPKTTAKNINIQKKVNFFGRRIYEYFIKLFKGKKIQEEPSGFFTGSKRRIIQHLTHLLPTWEKEVLEKYFLDNPQCQRCKSAEFPTVIEKPPLSNKKALKVLFEHFPKRRQQTIKITDIENQFKSQISKGDRLIVLCRTCRIKDDKSKLERYPHEMPAIMRQGPSELKY
jgi:hypothetical protein